jgi:endonuclease/exonuclease/phosphatase family metal-dependent hydrolase
MATTFRIASFNVENLFSRAKVLNLRDHSVAGDAIQKIDRLDKLLRNQSYAPQTKQEILQLCSELKPYIYIHVDRGALFRKRSGSQTVAAAGVNEWDGAIEFRRAKISDIARQNTAKVIKQVKADLACIVEAENRPTLLAFNSDTLGSRKFNYGMLIDGNDPRGIDVGLLSRFPVCNIRTHVYDRDDVGIIFSRDCLEVEVALAPGQPIHVLCNHLKSQGYGSPAANDAKRKRQAVRLAEILTGYDLSTDLVVVAGDFNNSPDHASLKPILSTGDLHDVLAAKFPNLQDRWTYHYGGRFQQIDYVLVSTPLHNALQDAGIERRGICGLERLTNGAEKEFKAVTSDADAASEHAAVWAEFTI